MTNDLQRATPASPTGADTSRAAPAGILRLLRDDSGQDLVEYALISALVGLASVAGIHGIAAQISSDMTLILNGFKIATGQ